MLIKRLLYCLLSAAVFSSCTQWKALTSRDSSAAVKPARKAKTKDVRFLDNISVTPGQVVTSKHSTTGPSMPSFSKRKQERDRYNAQLRTTVNPVDIEKADWLQLKYAIVLDETVENLTNVSLLKVIDEWWGTSYCNGGSTKDCIDCSAFTHVVMQNVYNVDVPRVAQDQYNASHHINLEDLTEGDLVFFFTGGREISHVGIYLKNNKFVHAATSGGVMVSDLNDPYWKPRYKGAGRFVNTSPATVSGK